MDGEPATAPSRRPRATPSGRTTVAAPRGFSVGAKLASATVALMLVFTALAYRELSASQREHLLKGKQMAALAVTRLFANSCAAPLVFGDQAAVAEALQRLGKSDDIPYAAVWSSNEAGVPQERVADLGTAGAIDVGPVPKQPEVRWEPERLVLRAPIHDVEGQLVGGAVVAFSLLREHAAIAAVQSNTLFASAGIAAGLTVLLLIIARLAIVRPLGELVVAANALERGTVSDIEIHSRDEIGQLAAAFRSMARAIASREERIGARNRDMRLVLDNVGQGFLSLDRYARLSEERSRIVEEWFGVPEPGADFGSYLARVAPKVAERFEVGWMLVTDSELPPELTLDHLPKSIDSDGRVFELTYKPISIEEKLERMLVVITDVTARVERERTLAAERETMSIFKRILSDRGVFEEFFDEASELVSAIRASDGSDPAGLQRAVHTLKGSASVYGLESIADLCHAVESELEAAGGVVADERKRQLEVAWGRVRRIRSEFSTDPGITVGREEHRALLLALEQRGQSDLASWLGSWRYEPASHRLELMGREIKLLAKRLGKGDVEVIIHPTPLRLPSKRWAPLWAASSHLIRNTADHGLEIPALRLARGKPERATVTLALARSDGELRFTLQDDGRGIDWSAIARRARSLGVPGQTRRDLERALFAPNVSSREEVTMMSGRGVGLNAVYEVVKSLGGRIEVASEPDRGTTFTIHLPLAMLADDPSAEQSETLDGEQPASRRAAAGRA